MTLPSQRTIFDIFASVSDFFIESDMFIDLRHSVFQIASYLKFLHYLSFSR